MIPNGTTIVAKVAPILILIALGYVLRRMRFFSSELIIPALKKLVVYIGLPSLLFKAFADTRLEVRYIVLVAIVFFSCGLLLMVGKIINRFVYPQSPYFSFLMTGFEAGMLGLPIYSVVFGVNSLYKFAVVDFGHEVFVFLVFVPLLIRASLRKSTEAPLFLFFKTPPIIGVLLGIVFGAFGIFREHPHAVATLVTMHTLGYLGDFVVPLICIIIGIELGLSISGVKRALSTLMVRLVFTIPIAFFLGKVVIRGLLKLDVGFAWGAMTLMALPPPFITPIFMSSKDKHEVDYVLDTLSLQTLLFLGMYPVLLLALPSLRIID